jgi:MFS family permease
MWWSAQKNNVYYSLFLEDKGYSDHQIGLLFSIGSLSLIVGQLFWGINCYRKPWLSHKHILLFTMCVAILVNILMFWESSYFSVLILCFIVYYFTAYSMGSMIDAWIHFRKLDDSRLQYPITRAFGSSTYAIVALLFGIVFQVHEFEYIVIDISIEARN